MPAKSPVKNGGFVAPPDPDFVAKVAKMRVKHEHYTRVVQRSPFEPDSATREEFRAAIKEVIRERKQKEAQR